MRGHVLAVRLDSAGDVLLQGPALRALAAGGQEVTLLCGPRGREAAELLPGVDRLLVYRAAWIDPDGAPVDRAALLSLVARIARLGVDEAVVFTSFHQSPLPTALLLRLAGVPRISAISSDYPGSLLDVRHQVADDVHEVQRSLSLAAAAGFALPDGDDQALAVTGADPIDLPGIDGPYVVVHPGTSVPARAWQPERHAELVGALVRRGTRVVVTGGPGEEALTAFVAGEPARGALDTGGRATLKQLAAILAQADAVVVGNTGPAHLAAAVGTPVVSLFAPTVPASRWRPWRVDHVLLGDQRAACAGSRARTCPFPRHPCLGCVEVRHVIDAVDQLGGVRAQAVAAA